MTKKQESIFWEVIDTFEKNGILPYVIVIGSWAEFLYSKSVIPDFLTDIKTRDIDFLYRNINKPNIHIPIISILNSIGFSCEYDSFTGLMRFVKEDMVEIEFLAKSLCSGSNHIFTIKSMGLVVEGLRDLNIIDSFAISVNVNGYHINVPDPAIFVIQKLLIYPTRTPSYKKEKDMESVRNILKCIESNWAFNVMLQSIYDLLSKKDKKTVNIVAMKNDIKLENYLNL